MTQKSAQKPFSESHVQLRCDFVIRDVFGEQVLIPIAGELAKTTNAFIVNKTAEKLLIAIKEADEQPVAIEDLVGLLATSKTNRQILERDVQQTLLSAQEQKLVKLLNHAN